VPINDRLGLYTAPEQFAMAWLLIGVAVLLFGWVEDIAARRPPELIPGAAPGRRARGAGSDRRAGAHRSL